ncbi:hypothetical protein LINPERHAP1_LOCUS4238 [Linum perenne]
MTRRSGNKSATFNAAAALLAAAVMFATLVAEAEAECGVNTGDVINNCQTYVMKGGPKTAPSKQCCAAIKGADITCACKNILTPAIQNLIDMGHAVYVGRTCGLKIPAGMKCGSVTWFLRRSAAVRGRMECRRTSSELEIYFMKCGAFGNVV